MNRHFTAGGAHGDADVAGSESRGVVHSIAHNGNLITFGFDAANVFNLVLRQAIAFGFFATDFGGDPRDYRLAVTGNHGDAPNSALLQFAQRDFGFSASLVLQ